MRVLFLWLVPVLFAETLPMQVRHGQGEGTVQFSVPGAQVPLTQEGAEWVGKLEMTYRVMGAGGTVLETGTEEIPLRMQAAQREVLLGQYLTITRQLTTQAGAAELRVEMTARPSGVAFAGALELGEAALRVESNVALVPFQVERTGGNAVTDVTAEDIQVLENGVPQAAHVYAVGMQRAETMPVDIALLYDRSARINATGRYAGEVYRAGLLEEFPNVRVAVYGFSDRLMEFTGPTRDEAALTRATAQVALIPGRAAPLFSSIQSVIERFDRKRAAVRILLVFSPGVPTEDTSTYEQVLTAARKAGVAIYPVILETGGMERATGRYTADDAGALPRNPRMRVTAPTVSEFRLLAESGGKNLTALPSGNHLEGILAQISKTLRNSYVASYQPREKGTREVKVVLRDKKKGKVIGGVRTVVR